MVKRAVGWDDLRRDGFGKEGESSSTMKAVSITNCPTRKLPACCGPTVGLGPAFPGEIVIPAYCPPPEIPGEDQRALAAAVGRAVQAALRGSVLTTQASQIERVGFRGRRNKITRVVAIHNAAADAATALALAFTGPAGTAVPVVAVGTLPTTILAFTTPQSMASTVERVVLTSQSIDFAQQVFFSIVKSGTQAQPEFSVVEMGQGVPLDIAMAPDETFSLMARLVGVGAFLVKVEVDAWLSPVAVRDDTISSRVPGALRPQECV